MALLFAMWQLSGLFSVLISYKTKKCVQPKSHTPKNASPIAVTQTLANPKECKSRECIFTKNKNAILELCLIQFV